MSSWRGQSPAGCFWPAGRGPELEGGGREIPLRLDRLRRQTRIRFGPSVSPDALFLLELGHALLDTGMADLERQRTVLHFFAAGLAYWDLPLRIRVQHRDLARMHRGIGAHPWQFVLQLALSGTGPLLQQAPSQPHGPQASIAPQARLKGFLAGVARELIARGGPLMQQVERKALAEGWGRSGSVMKLELTQYLVEHALTHAFKSSSAAPDPQEYTDFARTYLYPGRARWGSLPAIVADIPGMYQALFGIISPQPPTTNRT
jgi:hypothetical protein